MANDELDVVVEVEGAEITVGDLIKNYLEVRAERDMLAEAVETFGLQPAKPVPPVVKKPVQPAHGTLNPTDGASGVTTKAE